MARLFYALWPEAGPREALARLAVAVAGECGGRAVPAAKIHLTLAFLGEVGAERLALAHDAAACVSGTRFELDLDHVGSFRRARVAWAGAARAPRALLALHSGLVAALEGRGFALEARPFAAHVTLARNAARPLRRAAIEPVGWRARSFALVRTEPGTGNYATIGEWMLGE